MVAPALQIVLADVQVGRHLIEEVEGPASFAFSELLLVLLQETSVFLVFFLRPFFEAFALIPHIFLDLPSNVDKLAFFLSFDLDYIFFCLHF